MKKQLLVGCALTASLCMFSQNGNRMNQTGVARKLNEKETPVNEAASFKTVQAGPVKKNAPPVSSAKTSSTSATSCTHFTGSSNVFGFYQDGHEALQYNADVNAVSYVHRAAPCYSAVPNGNTGTQVCKWSVNAGTSWDSTVFYANTTNLGRYPQGGLYNPAGNTNVNNAYVVGMGETTPGSGFNGNWFASKKLTTPGTTTAGTDQQFFSNTAPFASLGKKLDFARYGFTFTKDGFVRALGEICNDINNTTSNTGRGNRGGAILKGTFNAGAFVWSYDSLIPPTIVRSDGSKQFTTYNNLMAWNDAGTVGYVVFTGARAGTSGAMKGYQPIVYKTTNSGASWSLLPANDFTTSQFRGITDRVWSTNTNTNLIVPFFSTGEGMDAAVDINDNLHIATTIVGTPLTHNDSLDYNSQWGTEKYSFPYGGSFGFPTIYDVYTTSSGGWNYHIVDSMGTEGPSGTSGQGGFAVNPWASAAVPLDARIQMSFSPDRKKMFYSWTESDTTVVGLHWNIYPNIMMKGYDVTIDKVTARVNVTGGVTTPSNADQQAYFHFMGNRTITTNSVLATNEIPFTISYNSANDGNSAVNTYYLKGASFTQTDFIKNPMRPVGVHNLTKADANAEISVFPNPSNGLATISLSLEQTGNIDLTVRNLVGAQVQSVKVNGQQGTNVITLDLTGVPAGVYLVNINAGKTQATKKLVIE